MALTTLQGTAQSGNKAVEILWEPTTSEPIVTTTGGEDENTDALTMRLADDARWVEVSWGAGVEMTHKSGAL